jgi:hypothetical protein
MQLQLAETAKIGHNISYSWFNLDLNHTGEGRYPGNVKIETGLFIKQE